MNLNNPYRGILDALLLIAALIGTEAGLISVTGYADTLIELILIGNGILVSLAAFYLIDRGDAEVAGEEIKKFD